MPSQGESPYDIQATVLLNTTTSTTKNRYSHLHLPSLLKLLSFFPPSTQHPASSAQRPAPDSLPSSLPFTLGTSLPFDHILGATYGSIFSKSM